MSVIFDRPKRTGRMLLRPATGRLCVGYRRRDFHEVYFEPISAGEHADIVNANENDLDIETLPELGLFRYGHGEATVEEPTEGEVNWLPHFDIANCESKSLKERRLLQKRFMYKAWTYCGATEPERVRDLEGRWGPTDRDHRDWRRWASWFAIAMKWKKADMKNRANTRVVRQTLARAAYPDGEADINSDDSDDEGYYGNDDDDNDDDDGNGGSGRRPRAPMGPPPRPSGSNGATSGSGKRRANGSCADTNGTSTKRSRHGANGTGASSRSGADLLMSGGLGRRSSSVSALRGSATVDDDDDEDEHDDDEDSNPLWDTHHPTPEPNSLFMPEVTPRRPSPSGSGGAGSLSNLNPFPTPIATQGRRGESVRPSTALRDRPSGPSSAPPASRDRSGTPSRRPHNFRQFGDWGNGATFKKADDDQDHTQVAGLIAAADPGADEAEGDLRRVAEVNGEIDEDEALERAREASLAPRENRSRHNSVHPSIEVDDKHDDSN